MDTNSHDYDAAMKALGNADKINLSNRERDICNIVIADYTCNGTASFKPTTYDIEAVHSAASRV